MPDLTEDTTSTQTGRKTHFGDFQHAQVTKALFEQEQTGAAIVGLDGRIRQANRALARMLGYSPEELTGKAIEDLVHGGARPGNLRPATQQHQGLAPVVNHLQGKHGEPVECFVDSYVICDERGKATHFLVFITDARAGREAQERNRFESELCRAQALQTLGMLAGGLAHDFNNALEVILGFASLALVRLATDDPLHEPLRIIEESARNAADLARQLLDVSRTDEAEKKTIDISELTGTILTIITRTFDRKIRIEPHIDPNLPAIKGFRNRLEQAILNLCLNARDAMPEGGTLTIEARSQTLGRKDRRLPPANAPGRYVRIAVRDTGTGMAAEILEQIFVPLFTTKEPGQGSGLGLAMVDRVVKAEGGFVAVSSRPGAGSEFALYLPAAPTERPRPAKPSSTPLTPGRETILVVDDEPRVLEFLEKGLTRLGYHVIAATSGSEAREIYSRQWQEIHCVLLDMIMPEMSGLEVYNLLRDINPQVRAVLSSGYNSGRVERMLGETGSAEFLGKPYTLRELSQAIRKIQQN